MFRLDHAVLNVRDRIDEAAAVYSRLGFALTPRGYHTTGSMNHLMVFERDYLELLGFAPGKETIRPELAESPAGLDALVFDLPDPAALYARAASAGFPVQPPEPLARPVEIDERREQARFTIVRPPRSAFEGGRVYFCHHHTPQFVWRAPWQSHANRACGIATLTIAVSAPVAQAARHARLLGLSAPEAAGAADVSGPSLRHTVDSESQEQGPNHAEEAWIALGGFRIAFKTRGALQQQLGSLACDPLGIDGAPRSSYMAMLTLFTKSLEVSRATLRRGGFTVVELDPQTVAVPASEALNVTLAFTGSL